jgi:sec-independent protein translocase protein TatB
VFDIGFSELVLTGFVALVVLGPERLPRAARFVGGVLRRLRGSWNQVRYEIEREIADEDLKRSLRQGSETIRDVEQTLRDSIPTKDPP